MYVKAIIFLSLALSYEVSCLPFFNFLTGQDNGYSGYSGRFARQYAPVANAPATYAQTVIDPATGQQVTTHYVTHSRPGGPITALVQNALNTVGRLVGDITGALGNALGGTLSGAGQLGQDIQDFVKPITINQIVRPNPGPAPIRPLPNTPPPARPPPYPVEPIDPDDD